MPTILLVLLAIAVGFALAATQSRLNARAGSDHAVHAFLIRAIRANRFRLFWQVPRLLNTTYCAALPLYLHWVFAHFTERAMRRAEWLLNPTVNTLLIVLCAGIAAVVGGQIDLGLWYVPAAAAAVALTPQFYHALSARNFGLSARGLGLLLLAILLSLAYAIEGDMLGPMGWVALGITAYLLWGFSTFAAQALVILGVLMLIVFGHWVPLAGATMGLAIFIAVHPRYSLSYLKHTLWFIHAYATELAPVYILARRYSIWRDLVLDIWRKIAADPVAGLRYAYENSALIVVGLNPMWTMTTVAWAAGVLPRDGALGFATDIALCGGLAAFLTSFRRTRFLGEPERYIEATAPFSAVAGIAAVALTAGTPALAMVLAVFAALDIAQLYASRMLGRHVASNLIDYAAIGAAIDGRGGGAVRYAGNNDQITKQLLSNDWLFVFCMAIGKTYCGMPTRQVFSTFPRRATRRIADHRPPDGGDRVRAGPRPI